MIRLNSAFNQSEPDGLEHSGGCIVGTVGVMAPIELQHPAGTPPDISTTRIGIGKSQPVKLHPRTHFGKAVSNHPNLRFVTDRLISPDYGPHFEAYDTLRDAGFVNA